MSAPNADALLSATEYREKRARFFRSEGSFQWYVRQHRTGLIEAGALLLIGGRYLVDPDKFDAYALEAGKRDAARQAASLQQQQPA